MVEFCPRGKGLKTLAEFQLAIVRSQKCKWPLHKEEATYN